MFGDYKKVKIEITGTHPLLMSQFKEEFLDESKRKSDKNLTKEQFAERSAYRDENGFLYIPKEAIWGCMIEAGRYVTYAGKKRISSKKESLLAIGVEMVENRCSLNVKDYIIDSRAVVNAVSGGRSMCYRPMIEAWKTTFHLMVNIKELPFSKVKELLEIGGRAIGLLAYRPSKRGWFGTFEVTKFEEVK